MPSVMYDLEVGLKECSSPQKFKTMPVSLHLSKGTNMVSLSLDIKLL